MGTRAHVLAGVLDSLSEEAEPRVPRIKTKVLAFGDILDATDESNPVRGENEEVTKTFTYVDSVIHSSTSCELRVSPRLGRAWSTMHEHIFVQRIYRAPVSS